jgi:mannitol-specific phosphotransferase system IIBC component
MGDLIPKLLSDDPLFVLISCHDINWPSERLAELLSVCMNSVNTKKNTKVIKKFKKLENKNSDIKTTSKNEKSEKNEKSMMKYNFDDKKKVNSNADIKSVYVAGGLLEYGPMVLRPNKSENQIMGNPLPLGGFARWSKMVR